MGFELSAFDDIGLSEGLLRHLLDEHGRRRLPRLERLWKYYRNEPESRDWDHSGRLRLAQEMGLPARLRGESLRLLDDRSANEREVVIENDIAWRIHAMVDFMFGRPIALLSTVEEPEKREQIQRLLDAVFEASGGAALLQDAALLGAVFGSVGLVLRTDELFAQGRSGPSSFEDALERAKSLRIEVIDPRRMTPLLSDDDFRELDGAVITFERALRSVESAGGLATRFAPLRIRRGGSATKRSTERVVEALSATHRQVYVDERLILDGPNPLGELPIAHIQNVSQPLRFEGLSEVEPLIPLQDELNTRLSDRAHRVTLQSFKMYLAKGIEAFEGEGAPPIGPGRVWSTDNPDAAMEAFGGDASSPSEESHIEEVRRALDKTSAVTPLAAGVLRAKVGQLSSENALRISLMGLISKTQRKQLTYGRGLIRIAQLALKALDLAGVFETEPGERGVVIEWPEALPERERDRLEAAALKRELGVPAERVLAELGYAPGDLGVQ